MKQKDAEYATIPLVLASTSPFRRELLERLQLPFECVAPEVDETQARDETAPALVVRLSRDKARAGARLRPDSLVIGSDQVAVCDGQILGKPGSEARAIEQLSLLSGKEVCFHTGLCVLHAPGDRYHECVVDTRVRVRQLAADEIERYVGADQPLGCAGSFRCESLGIALFEWIRSDDPTALIGLPLIRLTHYLREEKIQVP